MAGAVGDPELLAKGRRRVDHKFLFRRVVDRSRLHLRRIVSVAKLGEAEAAHVLQRIDLAHEGQVALSVQSHETAAEKIELDGKLRCKVSIDQAQHLVRSENILWVVLKVKDRYQARVCHFLDLGIGAIAHGIKGNVELVVEDGVVEQALPLLALLLLVVENYLFQIFCRTLVKCTKRGNGRIDLLNWFRLLGRRHHF